MKPIYRLKDVEPFLCGNMRLVGNIFGRMDMDNGRKVMTSSVVDYSFNDDIFQVETKNSIYAFESSELSSNIDVSTFLLILNDNLHRKV